MNKCQSFILSVLIQLLFMLYGEYLPKRVLELSEYSNECVEIDLH